MRYTDAQREVLRTLTLVQPVGINDLVFAVLNERYSLPKWMNTAIKHKWEPPRDWKKQEREKIANVVRDLLDDHELILTGDWRLRRSSDASPLEIIAEQAR